jgi:ribosomal protein L40E
MNHRRPTPPPPPPPPPPAPRPRAAAADTDHAAIRAGIQCPRCHCRDLRDPDSHRPVTLQPSWKVTHTKPGPGFIRQRRICRHCGATVWTRITIEHRSPYKD